MNIYQQPSPKRLGVFRTRDLWLLGLQKRRKREKAMRNGSLNRIRRGWYALPDAHPDLVNAVRRRGALTGLSACKLYGLWTPHHDKLQVAVPDFVRCSFTLGATRRSLKTKLPCGIVPLDTALIHVAAYESTEVALIVFESALNKGYIRRDQAKELLENVSRTRAQKILARLISNSQSGSETRVRNYIQSLRFKVVAQAQIDNVGRVDLLVKPRLIIECDSRAHHTSAINYQTDRNRSNSALIRGYLTIRLTYEDVWSRWDNTKRWVRYLLQHRLHKWKNPAYSPMSSLTE
ncbi:hypothetical protein HC352_00860 [Arcanobacterium buesumense]|uniref:DUF559 domain-containing protein n=1 Tax=Arcanobacterium buesumense TaxID=2722751 RepID=A0A6H2EK81_9ACTO|nr:hypothetical protein HC352_00860 [Arcanobacterium buesumense]